MNKKVLLGIGALIVLLAVYYFFNIERTISLISTGKKRDKIQGSNTGKQTDSMKDLLSKKNKLQ